MFLDAQRDFVAASETLAQAELDLALSGYSALALTGDIIDRFWRISCARGFVAILKGRSDEL